MTEQKTLEETYWPDFVSFRDAFCPVYGCCSRIYSVVTSHIVYIWHTHTGPYDSSG